MKDEHIRLLSSKEIKKFGADFSSSFGREMSQFFGDKPKIECVKTADGTIYLVEGRPVLVEIGGRLIPSLVFSELLEELPEVLVDRGAIPYVCNGADVMAPGVTEVKGSFMGGALIVVRDKEHRKALAVGSAFYGGDEMRQMRKGKVVKNIHYVGDAIWSRVRERIETQAKLKS